MQKFASVGERIFGLTPHLNSRGVRFYSANISIVLGEHGLVKDPQTLIDRYPWITEEPNYLSGLIEGLFDGKGSAALKQQVLEFSNEDSKLVDFIAQLLTKLGVVRPRFVYSGEERKKTGVKVSNLPDIKLIAQNIHAIDPKEEAILEFYRQKQIIKGRLRVKQNITNEEVIQEWIRLEVLLEHPPTISELRKLKQQGITTIDSGLYPLRFGKTDENKSGRSFPKARETLQRILHERNESTEDQTVTNGTKQGMTLVIE